MNKIDEVLRNSLCKMCKITFCIGVSSCNEFQETKQQIIALFKGCVPDKLYYGDATDNYVDGWNNSADKTNRNIEELGK